MMKEILEFLRGRLWNMGGVEFPVLYLTPDA